MNIKKSPRYDRTVPYNLLPLLPPPVNVIDNEVLLKWGVASRGLAELNKNILRLPNPSMLVNTISIQEAKSSSEIENIFTTEDELYKAISDSVKEAAANPNTKEVLRYREALWKGYRDMRAKGKINLSSIIAIYQQVKNTKEVLRSPQSQVVIKRGNSELRPGEIIYTPPRGKGVIEKKMKNLIQYLTDSKNDKTDPLLKMAIAHYQFEAIHPFSDGNGRTGRILNLLYLVNQELISHPVLYLSKYIIENKDEYYHHLGAVTQRNSWKGWIIYMLTAVEQTSRYTNRLIDEIINQMQSTLDYGKKELKWYNKEINEALFTQPYIKPKVIGNILGRTSRTTLTKYMSELTRLKILTAKEDGKEVFYINHDLIRILED
ncbi:MAG: Fic family protein [Bacteroidia bacterium]|nr:Fic family protein [Bacteroidia bacterium]